MLIELGGPSETAVSANDHLMVCERRDVGRCVLARVRFAGGDVLDRFSGEVGPGLRQHSLQVRPGVHISATRFIGYLAHGCAPNCRLDMERFELVALRDIAAGTLLTVDYAATEDVLFRQFACDCGAPTCRRWIAGRVETINEEGRRLLAADRKPAHP